MRSQSAGMVNGIVATSVVGPVAPSAVASCTLGARDIAAEGAGRVADAPWVVPSPIVVKNLAIVASLDDGKNGHETTDPKRAPRCMHVLSCAPVGVTIIDIGSPTVREKINKDLLERFLPRLAFADFPSFNPVLHI